MIVSLLLKKPDGAPAYYVAVSARWEFLVGRLWKRALNVNVTCRASTLAGVSDPIIIVSV